MRRILCVVKKNCRDVALLRLYNKMKLFEELLVYDFYPRTETGSSVIKLAA